MRLRYLIRRWVGRVAQWLGLLIWIDGMYEWGFIGNVFIGIIYDVIGAVLIAVGAFMEVGRDEGELRG